MSNGIEPADAVLPQELQLIIGGVSTTDEARAAARSLLLEGLVTDANRLLAAMADDAASLRPSVTRLGTLRRFLEVTPLTELADKVARLEGKLRASLGQASTGPVTPPPDAAPDAADEARVGAPPQPSVTPDTAVLPPVAILDTPDPVPDGPMGTFVSARRAAPKTVLYVDADGRELVREGGSRAWRNNNPGNISRGNFAAAHGGIGDDGRFAIFPDEKTGFNATVALLRAPSYNALALEAAIARYAPPAENATDVYIDFVVAQTGLARADVLGEQGIDKIRAIARAIKRKEGWLEGGERVLTGTADVPASTAASAAAEWLEIAEREAALPERERSEWPDPGENPRILEYFRIAAGWFDTASGDETDWCAAFVNYCLAMSGHDGTNHPGARSFFWNKNARFVRLPAPQPGCIAVRRFKPFTDPQWRSGPGHVGFVTSFDHESVTLLGGNQGNTVCRRTYPLETRDDAGALTSSFVAFMMPASG